MKWNRIFDSNKCTCMFKHPWPKTDALNFKETGRRENTCIIRLIYGYLSTNITNYHHFKFVFINQTKIKVSKIYLFLVKNVLFTPVLMLKLKLWFIHYISIYMCMQIFVVILVQCMLKPVAKMLRHSDEQSAFLISNRC